jgi:hypothetical protein
MIEDILKMECDEAVLHAEWERIILEGKSSPKLRKNAKERGKSKHDPKYYDPKYLEHTGAINKDEYVFLHKAMKYFKPVNVLEVGTWFGTSANAIAGAITGRVYTCDKNDLFVAPRENIVYHNKLSGDLMKCLVDEKIKIDLAFWDAKFMRGDSDILLSLVKPLVFMCHDYEQPEKGWRCVQELKAKLGDKLHVESHGIIGVCVCR